ncbi:MAG: hybrid sensor histidine kinase/response regulator [bacterium]|nr:hybrid sensor histidine kinase/response regulator [bacterium]
MSAVRILIVEDEGLFARDLQLLLEEKGYTVPGIVNSGKKAIEQAEKLEPDLVLMDIRLKGKMDGIEAAEYIRLNFDIPVVYLTAYTNNTIIERAKISEPFGYIVKPVQEKELYIAIEMALYKHRMENELKEAHRELKKLNDTKDIFFSIIAHDLKGPLSTFVNVIETLSESDESFLQENLQMFLGEMGNSAKNIHALLINLLEWSSLQRGLVEFHPKKTDLYEIISTSIFTLFMESAKQKNVELINCINPGTSFTTDDNMIRTILRNLVSNALKFTGQGGRVKISAKAGNEIMRIMVSDTGIGMGEKEKNKLFRIDQKIKNKGTAGETGSGLGLILCRELLEKMGGTIEMESEAGKGSTFTVALPLHGVYLGSHLCGVNPG